MNCSPLPEVTCGSLYNDSCVVYTGIWPSCFSGGSSCYRQSEFNQATGTLLCSLNTTVQGLEFIQGLIGVTILSQQWDILIYFN